MQCYIWCITSSFSTSPNGGILTSRWRRDTILLSISLLNTDRLSQFFHQHTELETCNKIIYRDPNIRQMCCYTTLWNVKYRKTSNNLNQSGRILTSRCFPDALPLLALDEVSRSRDDWSGSRFGSLSIPPADDEAAAADEPPEPGVLRDPEWIGGEAERERRSPLCGDIWLLTSSTTRSVSLFSPSLSCIHTYIQHVSEKLRRKGLNCVWLLMELYLTAMVGLRHLPYGITQCYLSRCHPTQVNPPRLNNNNNNWICIAQVVRMTSEALDTLFHTATQPSHWQPERLVTPEGWKTELTYEVGYI